MRIGRWSELVVLRRRRFIEINKQYIQDGKKKDIRNTVRKIEERNRENPRQPKIYIYAKLSVIDLIEKFSLYSDQNQIFECKIKMRQRHVNKYVF